MRRLSKGEFNRSPRLAYMAFLFQSFLKRPFGYIISILYVLYLAVIVLIVPAVIHKEPLFIWSMSAFNMPIFNLFFISAATSAIAVAIFRVGREDGTDLALSAKPMTKGTIVATKTITYLLIMLIFCLLSLVIIALILPIFGTYDFYKNPTGVVTSQYIGIIISSFVGNLVNMLFFGGIAIFICMVGGQVITMIGTIGVAFVMCMMNFIYPQVITSATDVISEKYGTDILSFRANTLAQYENPENAVQYAYSAIQCHTGEDWKEVHHLDTNETWTNAKKESKSEVINYVDFGKQLSNLYSAFGLEGMKVDDAKKLMIGINSTYNYQILPQTHVEDQTDTKNYPICIYDITDNQGKLYPKVNILGSNTGILKLTNWYVVSLFNRVDYDSVCVVSTSPNEFIAPIVEKDREYFGPRLCLTMPETKMNDSQLTMSAEWFSNFIKDNELVFKEQAIVNYLSADTTNTFYDGTWEEQTQKEKWGSTFQIVSKIHLHWAILAHEQQKSNILEYYDIIRHIDVHFPFTTEEIMVWNEWLNGDEPTDEYQREVWIRQKQENTNLLYIFNNSFYLGFGNEPLQIYYYSYLPHCDMEYAETYSNLYQYDVTSYYSIYTIVGVWTIISVIFMTGSVVVYKRTDFK